MGNVLYYGDNLDILRRYVKDESVDLIYLDPPFKSNQNYNVLFKEKDGTRAASQIQAFEDTWTWGQDDEAVYADLVTGGGKVADVMQAFRTFLSPCDMLAYLVMMAPRLVEMRRVPKATGSIYLHCDPTASSAATRRRSSRRNTASRSHSATPAASRRSTTSCELGIESEDGNDVSETAPRREIILHQTDDERTRARWRGR